MGRKAAPNILTDRHLPEGPFFHDLQTLYGNLQIWVFGLLGTLQVPCHLEISERIEAHARIGFLVRRFSAR